MPCLPRRHPADAHDHGYRRHELANSWTMKSSHHEEALIPSAAIANVPMRSGLGIVAAVLGVVITMGIWTAADVLGTISCRAGRTFMAFSCATFCGPMAKNLENSASEVESIST